VPVPSRDGTPATSRPFEKERRITFCGGVWKDQEARKRHISQSLPRAVSPREAGDAASELRMAMESSHGQRKAILVEKSDGVVSHNSGQRDNG
jgi:hypothetical protein